MTMVARSAPGNAMKRYALVATLAGWTGLLTPGAVHAQVTTSPFAPAPVPVAPAATPPVGGAGPAGASFPPAASPPATAMAQPTAAERFDTRMTLRSGETFACRVLDHLPTGYLLKKTSSETVIVPYDQVVNVAAAAPDAVAAPPQPVAPPPAYPPAVRATYTPVKATTGSSAREARYRGGFLFIPHLGFKTFTGKSGERMGAGLHLGALIGGHLARVFSLNAEIDLDRVESKPPAGFSAEGMRADVALSPLFHVDLGRADLVLGPKLGGFGGQQSLSSGEQRIELRGAGTTFGFNIGVFASAGKLGLGVLLAYQVSTFLALCREEKGIEKCYSGDRLSERFVDSDRILHISAAALF